jgi:hypothetical protein
MILFFVALTNDAWLPVVGERPTRRKIMRQRPNRAMNGAALLLAAAFIVPAMAQSGRLVGTAAFGDWRADKPV